MNDTTARPTLRDLLKSGEFLYGAELVTTRGAVPPGSKDKLVALGEGFASNPRISWISVTDNPGGSPMTPADVVGRYFQDRKEVVIHLTCKDMNRNGVESAAWRCASSGFTNFLALSGDFPSGGYRGAAAGTFDLDSVTLISLLRGMGEGLKVPGRKGDIETLPPTGFFTGCAVSPFKALESELVPQYLKLLRKIAAGAEYVIPQLGYDMRKFQEIMLFLAMNNVKVPVIGNVYVLNKTVAGMFNRNLFPGCVVSDELLALAVKYAAGPDKGKAFFTELAAKQIAVFKGLGFAGGYIAGLAKPEPFAEIVALAESYGADDWKAFAKEIQFPKKNEFYLFEKDPATGLGIPGRLDAGYLERTKRRASGPNVTLGYRGSRLTHSVLFTREKGLFGPMRSLFGFLDKRKGLMKGVHGIEHLGKFVMFGCQDCGDCSLPDIAYLCPMSACSKNERNGPCGGSHDGTCEVGEKQCIWVRGYERLRRFGEVDQVLRAPIVFYNPALLGTSSWANTYLGRDHSAPPAPPAAETAPKPASGSTAGPVAPMPHPPIAPGSAPK